VFLKLFAFGLLAVAGGASLLVGMVLLGTPRPCVDRAAPTGADAAFTADWVAFARQAATGGAASIAVTEVQATALASRSIAANGLPMSDVRVFFCADGHAEVAGRVSFRGWSVAVLAAGGIDTTTAPPRVGVTSVRAGALPGVLTSWVLGLVPGGASRELPLPAGASIRIEDGRAVITGTLPR